MTNTNGLSRIDSKLIGEAETEASEVSEVEALIAADDAEMSPGVIVRAKAKSVIGRFAATLTSGYLTGDTLQDHETLNDNIALMQKMIREEKNPDIKLRLLEIVNRAIAEKTNSKTLLLKTAEIGANRGRKKTRQENAPQRINGQFFNGPTQVFNGKPSDVVPPAAAG